MPAGWRTLYQSRGDARDRWRVGERPDRRAVLSLLYISLSKKNRLCARGNFFSGSNPEVLCRFEAEREVRAEGVAEVCITAYQPWPCEARHVKTARRSVCFNQSEKKLSVGKLRGSIPLYPRAKIDLFAQEESFSYVIRSARKILPATTGKRVSLIG